MPIKDPSLYPANWEEIRARVRGRSEDRCEECGVENRDRGYRRDDGEFVPVCTIHYDNTCRTMQDGDDEGDLCESCEREREWGDAKIITIVLTVAHLDHDPTNNDMDNLRHWCQRCHNRYDAPMRQRHAAETRRAKKRNREMFERGRG